MSTVAEIGSSSLFLPCPLDLDLPLSNIRHAQSFGFESKIQEKKKIPLHLPQSGPKYHWEETHVKAKKRVVAPTKKMAAAETGTYLLGLNLFPDSAGMLELWWEICPAA